ncbi:hypothetical protein AC579_3110 [Pseudocercospora musae]|uniref:Uncharacterized protein n=1 Tax=Pseudocercospora musae TaxID=113226 RepID=A0A139IBX2_9PEZI|nr:hypothetical protein AC579_3110 [Pseudocercospora musae]
MRLVLTFATTIIALASTVSGTLYGDHCDCKGLKDCLASYAIGCVKIEHGGPNCVVQTSDCNDVCNGPGYVYAYKKTKTHNVYAATRLRIPTLKLEFLV